MLGISSCCRELYTHFWNSFYNKPFQLTQSQFELCVYCNAYELLCSLSSQLKCRLHEFCTLPGSTFCSRSESRVLRKLITRNVNQKSTLVKSKTHVMILQCISMINTWFMQHSLHCSVYFQWKNSIIDADVMMIQCCRCDIHLWCLPFIQSDAGPYAPPTCTSR